MITLDDLLELSNHEIELKIEIALAYARKSRTKMSSSVSKQMEEKERIEKDLEFQLMRLEEFFERRTWSYEMFKEVKSGEDIESREVFNEVLDEIRSGEIDALVVVDFDRLTRGDATDRKLVLTALRDNAVVLVEEGSGKVYNPFNEEDLRSLEMKAMIANMEYKSIVTRNKLGKRYGAKKGNYVISTIPFGYSKNRSTKKLEINEVEAKIYKEDIVEPFLNGETIEEIAWGLNKKGIPSPRNKMWNETTIRNILKSEVYLGTVTFNKTKGSKNAKSSLNKEPYRKVSRDRWIITPNAHPKLITKEEYNEIQLQFKIRSKGKENAPKKFHPLSGMVKCYYCGETLKIQKEVLEKGDIKHRLSKCDCGKTSGGYCDLVLASIYQGIDVIERKVREQMKLSENTNNEKEVNYLLRKISELEKKIEKHEKAIQKVEMDYQMGDYTRQERNMYIESHNEKIQEYTNAILESQKRVSDVSVVKNGDKLDRIESFKKNIIEIDVDNFYEIRKLLMGIIKRVVWKRDFNEDIVDVKVNFL